MLTAGIDEAGRGPLAGPVVAAAVILAADRPIPGLADSKQLTARQRERLAECIRERAAAWALGLATVAEIDTHNILQATLLAMERAAAALAIVPEWILVDGNRLPARLPCPAVAIVRGDQTEPCISAASILAKTWRDQLMQELDQRYPHYGFKQHKGYGTPQHLQALARYGACPEHRYSFAPVLKVSSQLVDAVAAHPAVPE